MRLDKPTDQVDECCEREVALRLNKGAAELFIHFGSKELKAVFMRRVHGEAHAASELAQCASRLRPASGQGQAKRPLA